MAFLPTPTDTIVSSSFTRYTTTGVYKSGFVVANATASAVTNTIPSCARVAGGSGCILNAQLIDGSNQATAGVYEAWIFSKYRTSEQDSSSFAPSVADLATLVTVVPLSYNYVGTSGSSGNVVYPSAPMAVPFACAPNTSSLYWNLVVRHAYTPVASEQYVLTLNIAQD